MVLITTVEMFPSLTEADLKYLANLKATDKMVVLSKEGATMPVNLFMTLSQLKCKFEIKEIDTKDLFKLGFTIGMLCTQAGNEKVTILMNKEQETDSKNVSWVTTLTGSATPKSAPNKKVAKPKAEVTSSTPKEASTSPTASPKPVRKRRGKSIVDILLGYPELKKFKKVIETSEEALVDAIINSSDPEIGLPFQLQLRGFAEEKDAIARAIKKDFAKIKEQISS